MDPSEFFSGGYPGKQANPKPTESDPYMSDFSTDFSETTERPLDWGLLDLQDVNFTSLDDLVKYRLDNLDQDGGVEHAVKMTNEHCTNGETDAGVSGIHCHNTRSSGTEAVNSSQQFSSHSFDHRKDELDSFGKQKYSSINHKSSQGASCSTLPEGIGDEDEIQSKDVLGDPREGMVFSSEKELYDFYSNYAKKEGFNVRRGKTEYLPSDKSVLKAKYFLCTNQGHKSKEQIEKPTRYKRQDTRTGCAAMIKCTVNDGTWMISKVVLEHNHALKRSTDDVSGRAEGSHTMTSLSTGKIADEITPIVSNVNHSDVSQGTYKSHPLPGSDDTQELIDYFKNMEIEDPLFFHTTQVEAAQGMANFFWRDSRSKVDYMHFGDVLVLDTRTRINKYDMICAAFWGLNHHRQCIIFGCAVLVNQTVDSFNWLLQSFLKAMSWRKPRTIIADVSEEIANALMAVLPETCHCLPAWSICSSVCEYLPPLIDQVDRPGLDDLFSELVFDVHSQEEFESKWNCVIGKLKLHEDARLASLYRTREKWSHAFTKNAFSAGLLSIKNLENARAVFGNLSHETMTLYQIALRCGEAAKHMRMEELKEDRDCEKDMENLMPRISMMKEAQRLYTRPIFKMFQLELINIISLAIEESGTTATHCKFKLTEEGSTKIHTVEFDRSNLTLICSCGWFESVGILCFHALKVLNSRRIFKIPTYHLLKRWTKSAKDSLPVSTSNIGIADNGNPINSFYVKFMQGASHVAHVCTTKKRKNMALKSIYSTLESIAKTPRTEEVADAVQDSDGNNDMGQTI